MFRTVYVNGAFVPEAQAQISVFDRGLLFADAVYEVTSVVDGKLLDFPAHLQRLRRSLAELRLPSPATDDEILALLQKMIKQRTESAAVYEQGGRPELAENERAEIAVIETYLPKQMDEAETKAAIDAAIAEAGAAGPKDMGKVIAVLKGAYAGRMDFAKASGLVKAALNAKA